MKYSPGTSLISHTSRCSGVSVSIKSKEFVYLNLLLKLWRVYLLVTVPNLTLIESLMYPPGLSSNLVV